MEKKELEQQYLGKEIKIVSMKDEPSEKDYVGRQGVVSHIDDALQLHGTWGGLALIPGVDKFEIVEPTPTHDQELTP